MSEPYVYRIAVRFADTDAQGHVYFANYLTYCDEALAAYMRHIGVPWADFIATGVDLFYRSASIAYEGSATFEEVVQIETRIAAIGNSSIRSTYELRSEDGTAIGQAELVSVCVDPTTRRPTRVPDLLRDAVDRATAG
ncbi:MAG: acyl-CoA thioesterase [Sandaracinaceae bacterium]